MLDRQPRHEAFNRLDASLTDASAFLARSGLSPIEPGAMRAAGPWVGGGFRPQEPAPDLGFDEDDDGSGADPTGPLIHRVDELARRLRRTERELQRMKHRLALAEVAANTDPLTGIPNRRHFEEVLAAAVTVVRQFRQPLSVLMIDVDHFKQFNDDFGHPIGDHVLRFVAGVLTHRWQADTFAARYGGEEFAILSLRMTQHEALERAELIRTRLARHQMIMRGTRESVRGVTVSIGVAELGPDEPPDGIIRRADAALYAAKRAGRNRVIADRT